MVSRFIRLRASVVCLSLVALLGVAACGVASGTRAGNAAAGGTSTVPSGAATRMPASSPFAPPSASPFAPPEPTGSTGAVTVAVGQMHYATTDTIVVTVTNGLALDVFAPNHQTACTLVRLQRYDNGAWQDAGGCSEGSATTLVPVRAHTSSTYRLPPGGGMLKPAPWPAGTYRVAFRFITAAAVSRPGGDVPTAALSSAYSSTFTVG